MPDSFRHIAIADFAMAVCLKTYSHCEISPDPHMCFKQTM